MNHVNIYSNLIKELENKSISLSKYVSITFVWTENMQCFIDYVNILNPNVYFIFVYIIWIINLIFMNVIYFKKIILSIHSYNIFVILIITINWYKFTYNNNDKMNNFYISNTILLYKYFVLYKLCQK